MPTYYGAIDLSKNELRNAVVQNLPSAPSTPLKGQIYMDSVGNILYWYNGSGWIAAQGGAGATLATTVTTEAVGDAPVVGVSTNVAREDHKHGREAFGPVTTSTSLFGLASSNGVNTTLARSDHFHGLPPHDNSLHSIIPLSVLATATADVNLGGFKLTNVGAPVSATDATNKTYVDNLVAGLSWKDSVRVASTVNNAASGLIAVDGVTVVAGDRVLQKNQSAPEVNGIYIAAVGAWARATDADTGAELVGMAVFVEAGTTNSDTAWVLTNNAPIVLNSDPLTYVQFTGGGAVTAGAGMTQSGNTLNVIAGDTSLTIAADSMIVNTAVIASATRNLIAGAGLTGGGDLTADRTFNVVAGDTSLTVAADSVIVNTAVIATVASITGMVKKFAGALTGTASPEVVTHNLNTRDIQLTVLNGASPYTAAEVDWDATTVNTATIRYNPNLGAGYRVVVAG